MIPGNYKYPCYQQSVSIVPTITGYRIETRCPSKGIITGVSFYLSDYAKAFEIAGRLEQETETYKHSHIIEHYIFGTPMEAF